MLSRTYPTGWRLSGSIPSSCPRRVRGAPPSWSSNLKVSDRELPCLIAYRPRLLPAQVVRLGQRLRAADAQLRLRDRGVQRSRVLLLATESAGPGTLRVCERERLGLIDLRGTVLVPAGDVFVKVIGTEGAKREPRTPLFYGKGGRIVRALLNAPSEIRTIRAISAAVEASYAYTFDTVHRLEQEGFVYRRSPRSGVILRDPIGLLGAWIESGERTAATIEPFYARSTGVSALKRGLQRLQERGGRGIFTLGSGLSPEAVTVTALPHGLYSGASSQWLQEAFELRPQTPHNFLVLRPDPIADTDKGGIAGSVRELPQGPAVSIPQLIVDLHGMGAEPRSRRNTCSMAG